MFKTTYVVAVVSVVVICVAFGYVVSNRNLQDMAHLGDSFGVLSALFTACAFFGVIVAQFEQGKESERQRDEIERMLKLMGGLNSAQAGARKALEAQQDLALESALAIACAGMAAARYYGEQQGGGGGKGGSQGFQQDLEKLRRQVTRLEELQKEQDERRRTSPQ
ncbi:MAG: hypothetical protein HYY93_01190 [Planctomycetes bacterium]|nr:hypothetical protein [Planctomycetota bacterium]